MKTAHPFLLLFWVLVWVANSFATHPSFYEQREKNFCEGKKDPLPENCDPYEQATIETRVSGFEILCTTEMSRLGCDQLKSKTPDPSVIKDCSREKVCENEVTDMELKKCAAAVGEMAWDQTIGTIERAWENHQARNSCSTDLEQKKKLIESYNEMQFIEGPYKITSKETDLLLKRNCDQIEAVTKARGKAAIDKFYDRVRSGTDAEATKKMRELQGHDPINKLGLNYNCYTRKAKAELGCAIAAITAANMVVGGAATIAAMKVLKRFGVSADALSKIQYELRNGAKGSLSDSSKLVNADRVSAAEAVAHKLSPKHVVTNEMREAVTDAHNVGAKRAGAGHGQYTRQEVIQKYKILRKAGWTESETREILLRGIAGKEAPINADLLNQIISTTPAQTSASRPPVKDAVESLKTQLDEPGLSSAEKSRLQRELDGLLTERNRVNLDDIKIGTAEPRASHTPSPKNVEPSDISPLFDPKNPNRSTFDLPSVGDEVAFKNGSSPGRGMLLGYDETNADQVRIKVTDRNGKEEIISVPKDKVAVTAEEVRAVDKELVEKMNSRSHDPLAETLNETQARDRAVQQAIRERREAAASPEAQAQRFVDRITADALSGKKDIAEKAQALKSFLKEGESPASLLETTVDPKTGKTAFKNPDGANAYNDYNKTVYKYSPLNKQELQVIKDLDSVKLDGLTLSPGDAVLVEKAKGIYNAKATPPKEIGDELLRIEKEANKALTNAENSLSTQIPDSFAKDSSLQTAVKKAFPPNQHGYSPNLAELIKEVNVNQVEGPLRGFIKPSEALLKPDVRAEMDRNPQFKMLMERLILREKIWDAKNRRR